MTLSDRSRKVDASIQMNTNPGNVPTDHRRILSRVGGLVACVALLVSLLVPMTAFGQEEKVTICHAAGLRGSGQPVTVELAASAVYGPGGHFNEDGTTKAGHEGDHLGACAGETTETTLSPPTTTQGQDDSTSTTEPEEDSTTTTSSPDATSEVESTVDTTSTTIAGANPTTSVEVPNDRAGLVEGPLPEADQADDLEVANSTSSESTTAKTASETLPYTGSSTSLIYPAWLLLLAGATVVFITRGFGADAGAHIAVETDRFGLGLHRGKHESLATRRRSAE
jgi:hypothetical protein